MKNSTQFVDAKEMNRLHPETFQVPDKEELASIKPGCLVKLCAGRERFWANVQSVDNDKIVGIVDDDLVDTELHGLNLGDSVYFLKSNIYSILDKNLLETAINLPEGKLSFKLVDDNSDLLDTAFGITKERGEELDRYITHHLKEFVDKQMVIDEDKEALCLNQARVIALASFPCNTPQEISFVTFIAPKVAADMVQEVISKRRREEGTGSSLVSLLEKALKARMRNKDVN